MPPDSFFEATKVALLEWKMEAWKCLTVAAAVDVDGRPVDHVVLVLEPRGELALLHGGQARVGVRVALPGQHLWEKGGR